MKTLPDDTATRESIIEACRRMTAQGLNHGSAGNLSVRVPSGVLITPSGVAYEAMTADMLVLIPPEGPPPDDLPAKPSSEWQFHQSLLASRPDMVTVVHAHPPWASVLAVQRRPIPACHYMIAAFGGDDIPLAGYALFGSGALAEEMQKVMASRHGCLMANHGATVLGETIEKGLWRMQELESLARTYLMSALGGAPVLLSGEEIAEAAAAFAGYGPTDPQPR